MTTLAPAQTVTASAPARRLLSYFVLGTAFGVVLTKAQVVSWFRIQEMFRFQSFYMYGVLASAVVVAGISIAPPARIASAPARMMRVASTCPASQRANGSAS